MVSVSERPRKVEIIISRFKPSEIEAGKLEFYKNHPELIMEVRTKVLYFCAHCLGEIRMGSPCLTMTRVTRAWVHKAFDEPIPECPHCGETGLSEQKTYERISYPLEHVRIRRTEYVTSRKVSGIWPFRKVHETLFKEDVVLAVAFDKNDTKPTMWLEEL